MKLLAFIFVWTVRILFGIMALLVLYDMGSLWGILLALVVIALVFMLTWFYIKAEDYIDRD